MSTFTVSGISAELTRLRDEHIGLCADLGARDQEIANLREENEKLRDDSKSASDLIKFYAKKLGEVTGIAAVEQIKNNQLRTLLAEARDRGMADVEYASREEEKRALSLPARIDLALKEGE